MFDIVSKIKRRIANARASIEAQKSYLENRVESEDWVSVRRAASDIQSGHDIIQALEWVLGEVSTDNPPLWAGETSTRSGIHIETLID
ncbi:hypothetical protein K0U83_01435 [bacterium]|nr:hypothetical protein [bacterium]